MALHFSSGVRPALVVYDTSHSSVQLQQTCWTYICVLKKIQQSTKSFPLSVCTGSTTHWSRHRHESCRTCVRRCERAGASVTSSHSTWVTRPKPSRSCCAPMTSITTWAKASGSSFPRVPHSLRESAPRSVDVSVCVRTPYTHYRILSLSVWWFVNIQPFTKCFLWSSGDRLEQQDDKTGHELLALRWASPLKYNMQKFTSLY